MPLMSVDRFDVDVDVAMKEDGLLAYTRFQPLIADVTDRKPRLQLRGKTSSGVSLDRSIDRTTLLDKPFERLTSVSRYDTIRSAFRNFAIAFLSSTENLSTCDHFTKKTRYKF